MLVSAITSRSLSSISSTTKKKEYSPGATDQYPAIKQVLQLLRWASWMLISDSGSDLAFSANTHFPGRHNGPPACYNITLEAAIVWWRPGNGPWLQRFTWTAFPFFYGPDNCCCCLGLEASQLSLKGRAWFECFVHKLQQTNLQTVTLTYICATRRLYLSRIKMW